MSDRDANDAAVERLRKDVVSERFGEIYQSTSGVTRAQLSRDEFITKLKQASAELKRVDREVNWVRNETILYDRAVFRDDNFSSLDLANHGEKINVILDWAPGFELCGMAIHFDEVSSTGMKVFRNCD
jgi:hypothetical protein